MAVLLMASAPDSASAVCQLRRHCGGSQAPAAAGRRCRPAREHHLEQAQAEHVRAHGPQLGQVELQPDHEHQEHHAELGQVPHAGRVLGQGERIRADQHAHGEVAEHGRELERTAQHHAQHGGHQVDEGKLEGGH
jgi:hypothetical protein